MSLPCNQHRADVDETSTPAWHTASIDLVADPPTPPQSDCHKLYLH
jgi:hypothetical protein